MATKEQVILAYRELIKSTATLEADDKVLLNADFEHKINNESEANLENIFKSIIHLTMLIKEAIDNR